MAEDEEDAASEASEWEAREQEERAWRGGRRRRVWEGSYEAVAESVFLSLFLTFFKFLLSFFCFHNHLFGRGWGG